MKKQLVQFLRVSLILFAAFSSGVIISGCARESKSYDRGYSSGRYNQPYSAAEDYRPYRPAPRDPKSF